MAAELERCRHGLCLVELRGGHRPPNPRCPTHGGVDPAVPDPAPLAHPASTSDGGPRRPAVPIVLDGRLRRRRSPRQSWRRARHGARQRPCRAARRRLRARRRARPVHAAREHRLAAYRDRAGTLRLRSSAHRCRGGAAPRRAGAVELHALRHAARRQPARRCADRALRALRARGRRDARAAARRPAGLQPRQRDRLPGLGGERDPADVPVPARPRRPRDGERRGQRLCDQAPAGARGAGGDRGGARDRSARTLPAHRAGRALRRAA